jgi:hypothetical protein
VGNGASGLTEADKLQPYSKVTVTDGTNSYTSGDNTGRELTVNVPLLPSIKGDTLAANILAAVKNYRYQPYEAADALLDPAAELGDGVTVGGIYGGIHAKTTTFSRLFRATVSAPAEEEIDNEYPYLSAQERDAVRQKKQTAQNTADIATNTSDIETNAGDIATNARAISSISADIANFGEVYATKASVASLSAKVANISKLFSGETYTGLISTPSLYVNGAQYVGTVIRYKNEDGVTTSKRVLAAT